MLAIADVSQELRICSEPSQELTIQNPSSSSYDHDIGRKPSEFNFRTLRDWNLTLFLGAQLKTADGNSLSSADLLLALIRLPWFREGFMPGWLRKVLVGAISKPAEKQGREALQRLMMAEPTDTSGNFTVKIVPDLKPQLTRFTADIVKFLRNKETRGPLKDEVYATFISGKNPGVLAVPVPERVARLLGVRRGRKIFQDVPRWERIIVLGLLFLVGSAYLAEVYFYGLSGAFLFSVPFGAMAWILTFGYPFKQTQSLASGK